MSDLREWEASLAEAVRSGRVPSVAYGVARGGETLALGAFGETARTPYALASVTKPMTATAVMMLVEAGLVDLDEPADPRIQSRAGDAHEATVRRVLNHTAGLPLHYRFYYADEPDRRPPFDETMRRYGKTFTAPGERFHYSNLGYGILDDLIARVSGKTYEAFIAERVFGPLGMADASIGRPSNGAVPTSPEGVGYPPYDFDHPGGSAAWASVADLLAFGRFHLGHGPALLSLESRRRMREGIGYALGWQVSDRRRRRVVGHTGGMGGVRTVLRLVPELDLVVAVLTNGEDDLAFQAADDALVALDPVFRDAPAPSEPTVDPTIPPEWDGLWSGEVETRDGERLFALDVRGNEVEATLEGQTGPVEGARFVGGRLTGVFDGDLGTDDAGRRPYRIHLDLGLRDGALDGAAVAISTPGPRLGDALSYWTNLARL